MEEDGKSIRWRFGDCLECDHDCSAFVFDFLEKPVPTLPRTLAPIGPSRLMFQISRFKTLRDQRCKVQACVLNSDQHASISLREGLKTLTESSGWHLWSHESQVASAGEPSSSGPFIRTPLWKPSSVTSRAAAALPLNANKREVRCAAPLPTD